MRIACIDRISGKWITQAWRLSKDDYVLVGRNLIGRTPFARKVLADITNGGKLVYKGGDDFQLKLR